MNVRTLLLALLAACASSCVRPVVVAPASGRGRSGLMLEETPQHPACEGRVDVLPAVPNDAEVLRELTVTCDYNLPRECEEALVRRACEIGARAVVFADEGSTAPPPGARGNVLVRTRNGTALR